MSKYTTGELAKLCGVTVRTVQYYDARGILIPSELTEGGRRLYSDDDLKRMKVICFLRELDIPINTISQMLKEEHGLQKEVKRKTTPEAFAPMMWSVFLWSPLEDVNKKLF